MGGLWEAKNLDFRTFGQVFGKVREERRESEKKEEKSEEREEGPTQLSELALRRYLYKGRLPRKPPLLKLGTVGQQFEVSPVCCEKV